MDSTHTVKGFQRAYGNIEFTNQKTVKHEVWLEDVCGPDGGDGFGLKVNPLINTPAITSLSPDYYNTAGCGTSRYYQQNARQVWFDGVPKDLVNMLWQMYLTDEGQLFNYGISPCHDNPLRAGNSC